MLFAQLREMLRVVLPILNTRFLFRLFAVCVVGLFGLSPLVAVAQESDATSGKSIVQVSGEPGSQIVPAGASKVRWEDRGFQHRITSSDSFVQDSIPKAIKSSDLIAVHSLGPRRGVALTSTGKLVGWGPSSYYSSSPTIDGLKNFEYSTFIDFVGTNNVGFGIQSSGYVRCWPSSKPECSSMPADLGQVQDIDLDSSSYGMALKFNGSVVIWHDSYTGKYAPKRSYHYESVSAKSIAKGLYWAAVLKTDGNVALENWNPFTKTGTFTNVAGLSNVVAMSGNDYHILALKSDGTVVAYDPVGKKLLSVPAGLTDVVAVEAGELSSSYAIKSDGTVVAWAEDPKNSSLFSDRFAWAKKLSNVGAISADETGTVYALTAVPSPMSTSQPTVSGDYIVGAELSANAGYWTSGASLSYQWYRNSSPISGATGARYTIQSADLGASLKVKVTGVKRGYTTSSRDSKPSGKILASSVPQVTGTVAVGSTVGVSVGSWTSKSAFSYQWLRNGVAISKATKSTYKLSAADAAAEISVRLTGKRSGYQTVVRTSAATQKVMTAATPSVSGEFIVGEDLTANTGTWTDGVTLSYQWLRNGQVIAGETNQKYTVQAADVNQSLRVRVTGSKASFATIARESVASSKVPLSARPTVQGTPSVGSTLNVVVGSWTAKTAFSYQWLRDGEVIKKATKSTYKLTSSDAGKTITVRVTGKKSGYATVSRTSSRSD